MRSASVKRVLSLLEELAANQTEKYATFWAEFGRVLKEGVVEDVANRDEVCALLRRRRDDDRIALRQLRRFAERQGLAAHRRHELEQPESGSGADLRIGADARGVVVRRTGDEPRAQAVEVAAATECIPVGVVSGHSALLCAQASRDERSVPTACGFDHRRSGLLPSELNNPTGIACEP